MVMDRQPPLDPSLAKVLGIGSSKRMAIPVTEQLRLYDRVADNLRALANEIDVAAKGLAGHPAPIPLHAIPTIVCAVDAFNSKLRVLCKQYGVSMQDGRPTNKDRRKIKEQADNRSETEELDTPAPRLQIVCRDP